MVEAILATVGGIVTVVSAGYVYLKRGGTVSADTDGDGDSDFYASEDEVQTPSPPTQYEAEAFIEEVEDDSGPLPEVVREKADLTAIKGIGPTRARDLREVDIDTPQDVYYASDETLLDISGIGETTIDQIRSDIGGIDYEGEGN
jgi:predicted flap endonuclease-1-like 5' DNA nuclease